MSSDWSWCGARGSGERQAGAPSASLAVIWLWKKFEGGSFSSIPPGTAEHVECPLLQFPFLHQMQLLVLTPHLPQASSFPLILGRTQRDSMCHLPHSLQRSMSVRRFHSLSHSLMNISLVHIRLSQAPGISLKHFSFLLDSVPHSSFLSLCGALEQTDNCP